MMTEVFDENVDLAMCMAFHKPTISLETAKIFLDQLAEFSRSRNLLSFCEKCSKTEVKLWIPKKRGTPDQASSLEPQNTERPVLKKWQ